MCRDVKIKISLLFQTLNTYSIIPFLESFLNRTLLTTLLVALGNIPLEFLSFEPCWWLWQITMQCALVSSDFQKVLDKGKESLELRLEKNSCSRGISTVRNLRKNYSIWFWFCLHKIVIAYFIFKRHPSFLSGF